MSRTYHVIKVWYQNDWGLYGRRDERITRELRRDARIARVLHIEPPLSLARLRTLAAAPRFEHNLELNLKRLEGTEQDGIQLFTPILPDAGSARDAARVVSEQIVQHVQRLQLLSAPLILWLAAPAPVAELVLEVLGPHTHRIVTEIEDDHRCYCAPGSPQHARTQAIYERLVRSSDIAFSNALPMVAEWRQLQPEFHHVPNAVDAHAFAPPLPRSPEIEALPRPIVTYVGNLELRLDWEILEQVAATWQGTMALVGPPGESARELARRHACVRLLGPVRAPGVPAMLAASDVLILPHVVNAMTRGMDPQKLHEYLASGRPVVATPVQGTEAHAELVAIAAQPAAFVRAVHAQLESDSPALAAQRVAAALARTWQTVVPAMLDRVLAVVHAGARLKAERKRRYHSLSRPEVRALVPASAVRVLDVGCGTGALGRALKSERALHVTGIEMDAGAAAEAASALDAVHCGDVMQLLPAMPERSFDAVILADVLEHVAQPEVLLAHVARILDPHGHVILSVPNVRHWSVLREILEGDFQYREAGILDRGHLRFYTRKSLLRLLAQCGLAPVSLAGSAWHRECAPDPIVAALAAAGLDVSTLAEESGVHQFLVVAAPIEAAAPERDQLAVVTACAPFAASVNHAVAATTRPFVAIVAPGVALTDEQWARLVRHLRRDARIGAVAPSTDDADCGDPVSAAIVERFPGMVEDTPLVASFCCVVRRDALNAAGPITDLGSGGEAEMRDCCMRLRRLGYRIVTARDVFVPRAASAGAHSPGAAQLAARWRDDPILAGIAAQRAHDLVRARALFEASWQSYAACVDGHFHLAALSLEHGEMAAALEHVDRYLARHPRSREALLIRASALLGLARQAEVGEVLQLLERECYLPASLAGEIELIRSALVPATPAT